MRRNTKNNDKSGKGFINHLSAEKKKAVLALCLIVLMIAMWVKMLTRTSPKAAEAGLITGLMDVETQSEPEINVSFIELPKVAGRNDVIVRDFFASNGWQEFIDGQGRKSAGVEKINIVKDDDQEVIKMVAENLNLEAIVSGEDPMAFINDKVLRAGDKLTVGDGIDGYECEVVEIKENIVVIECRESRITLKMTQVN